MMKKPYSKEDFIEALNTLGKGGIILYPTDTVWGLGCDATNKEAVERIFSIKNRMGHKSLIILVNGYTMLERYTKEIPSAALKILEISETPLTIIYPEGKNLAPGVCDEDGSAGIRLCSEVFCNDLITAFRKPIVSTSANKSNEPPPSVFSEIDKEIINAVDYAVKYRQNDSTKNKPSPVIKIGYNDVIRIIRE